MISASRRIQIISLFVVCLAIVASAKKSDGEKPAWAKKSITDFSDADMERLLDQWNVSAVQILTRKWNMFLVLLIIFFTCEGGR